MKKLLSIALAATIAISAAAQKTTFGLKAGLNLSNISSNDHDINHDKKMLPGFHVGGVADISISRSLSLQPQLLLQQKGFSLSHGDHSDKFVFTSIDIPVNLLYRTGGFFVGGGPNAGINIDGRIKEEGDSEKITFGNNPGEVRRINLGVNLLSGYQLQNGLFFSANFLADLTNWSNIPNTTWRNNLIGISAGYMFGRK